VGYDLDMIAQRRTDPGTRTPGNGYVLINPSVGSDAVSSAFNFVKIGHFAVENGNRTADLGDAVIDANQSGDIAVVVGRDLTMLGGTTPNVDTQTIYGAFSQIGHGGPAITGNLGGSITVLVKNDLAVIQGSEIGVGNITTTPLNNYAMIGHGDHLTGTTGNPVAVFRQVARGLRDGHVTIAAGRHGAFNGAMVGHLDPLLSPQSTFGNLQVAVSRLNPFYGGEGNLTAVNGTVFSSGGFGRDRVEFFLPERANNFMNGTTRINERTDTFATAPANFAAPFNKDDGIFAGRAISLPTSGGIKPGLPLPVVSAGQGSSRPMPSVARAAPPPLSIVPVGSSTWIHWWPGPLVPRHLPIGIGTESAVWGSTPSITMRLSS